MLNLEMQEREVEGIFAWKPVFLREVGSKDFDRELQGWKWGTGDWQS